MQNAIATAPAANPDSTIRAHDRLIRHLATRFVGTGVSIDDLIQEGRIALWHSSQKWRADGGANLWTFSRRAVFAAMLRCASAHVSESHAPLDEEAVANAEASVEVSFLVHECLELLSEEEREIVRLFMSGESIRNIATLMCRSKSDVDRVFQGAVATLRERVSAS